MPRYYIDYCPRSYTKPKYDILAELFGEAVDDIKWAFLRLDEEYLAELLEDYGTKYGANAANYARKTYPKWARGRVNLSGQTMERLIELVPPYLSSSERYALLKKVLKLHRSISKYLVRINLYEPAQGFNELNTILGNLKQTDVLSYLPATVMKAATWLYNNDITAARTMLAQADQVENELIKAKAIQEIEQLKKLIVSEQVDSASYSVSMPSGCLTVETYTPFFHLKTFLPKSIARFF